MRLTPRHSHERAFAFRSLVAVAVASALVVAGLLGLPEPAKPWLLGAYLVACPVAAVAWYRRLSDARERDAQLDSPVHLPTVDVFGAEPSRPIAGYTSAVES
jgi:hypothetical protein